MAIGNVEERRNDQTGGAPIELEDCWASQTAITSFTRLTRASNPSGLMRYELAPKAYAWRISSWSWEPDKTRTGTVPISGCRRIHLSNSKPVARGIYES